MKRVIDNLYTLKGAKSGTRIDELKLQLGIGTDTPTSDYVKHSLATAANDFLIASGSGTIVKKTLAETKVILGLGSAAYEDIITYIAQEEISSGESETTLSLDAYLSLISTDSAGDTFILPDGTVTGQLKKILMKADGGDSVGSGEGIVTGTFGSDVGTLTFNNAGEFALLQWDGSQWNALELGSMFDTTNTPAFSS
jgi:hypothetical protein